MKVSVPLKITILWVKQFTQNIIFGLKKKYNVDFLQR